jgi:hypothetical protein
MNITLSIDEQLANRVRETLHATGKTLNQEIREHFLSVAGGDEQLDRDLEFLRATAGQGNSHGWDYNREDAYDQRLQWPRP